MESPSDFAQALFDLGASICSPTSPACALCPWMEGCGGAAAWDRGGTAAAGGEEEAADLRHGVHFWLTDRAGNVLLRRRPASGLAGRDGRVAGNRVGARRGRKRRR